MERRRFSPALIFAIVLLLMPVLYVGSYLAVVVPDGISQSIAGDFTDFDFVVYEMPIEHYRLAPDRLGRFFWPLEQIDRMVRPAKWVNPFDVDGPPFPGGRGPD